MKTHLDIGNTIVIGITFILFAAALLTKGLTHDLFLEAGVFLVSVKIIMIGYKNNVANKRILAELESIKNTLKEKEN